MYCVRCGRQIVDEANYCSYCGMKAYRPEPVETPATGEAQFQEPEPVSPAPPEVPVTETLETAEAQIPEQQPVSPATLQAVAETPWESSMSLTALVCGILAICLFWIVLPGIALGLVALVYGIRSTIKYKEIPKGQAVAGFILGITAIALSACMILQFAGPGISGLAHIGLNSL